MSKFERHKKSTQNYIYPHKHCKRCGQMIEEAHTYCSQCYNKIKQKKQRKWFKRKKTEDVEDEGEDVEKKGEGS